MYIYELSPLKEAGKIDGVSNFAFAPRGPFLAYRNPGRVCVVADPRNYESTRYDVSGTDGQTQFRWSPLGNELICWDATGNRVQSMYIDQLLYGSSPPNKPPASGISYDLPQWSPDGTMVALQRKEKPEGGKERTAIYTLLRERVHGATEELGRMVPLPIENNDVKLVGWLW